MLQESLVMDQNLQDYELSTNDANINPPLEVKKTGSTCRPFEKAFRNTQWRKDKQMQHM